MRSARVTLLGFLTAAMVACWTDIVPEAGTMEPLSIPAEMIVIGDFGSGRDSQYEVAETMRKTVTGRDVELFVTTGDNFYGNDVEAIWDEPYGWLEDLDIEIAAAWGNHDLENETRRNLVQDALDPPGHYYSLGVGDGKLIVLDSNSVTDSQQKTWLEDEFEDAGSPVIVVFHHPPYSCGVYGTEDIVNDAWLPLFEEFGVDVVLNGHEHHYERFLVEGTTYVVTGGGGQSLRSAEKCPADTPEPLASNYTDHHFIWLTVGDGVISAQVVAADGSMIDEFEIDY